MEGYVVVRPKDTVVVTIMFSRQDGKYHFVNLTHPHICPCAFDTIEDALADMDEQIKLGNVIRYCKTNIEMTCT